MRITDGEAEIRKARMLLTAYRLFCENGIDHVSVAQIAKASNVSPNSVFRYFDSKAALVEQTQNILWKRIIDYISEGYQDKLAQARNGEEELRVLLYGFVELYQNHKDYVLFAYDYKAFLIREKIQLSSDAFFLSTSSIRPLFLSALKRGQQDGSIVVKHSAELCFQFLWEFLRSFVENLVVHSKIYQGDNPLENVLPELIEGIIASIKS